MKLSQCNFELPEERLAEYPADHRDESRLMVLDRKKETIEHKTFKDVVNYFDEGDAFVFNNTKVFPARLIGNKEKTGARIEVFLLRELSDDQRLWDVLVDPARKIRIGNKLYFGDDDNLVAEVIDNTTSRGRTLRFLYDGSYDEFRKALFELGQTPLPKFIKREEESFDKERYQTIYAKHEGAVAAPTAGMHFSKHLLKRLETNSDVDPTIVEIDKKRYFKMLKEDLSKVIAGRSINEILKRFDNKIRDPRGAKKGENVSKIIKDFLKIKCPINKAASELNKFFKKNKINLIVDQKYFPTSDNKISKLNVVFSASFGRQLEYYTGMVFKIDIKSKSKNRNIINGGRYDKLISDLGSKKQVPAVGAALNLNY